MHNINLKTNYPHLLNKKLFTELPFQGCTDYEILVNCLSSKTKFLELLENNNLNNQFNRNSADPSKHTDCKYQNEISFQNINKVHSHNALKVFHLNIRSINKHKILLKSYIESLKCNFDLIFLTETGNASINEIEEIFHNYKFFLDEPIPGKGSKGGAGILVNINSFNYIEEIFENENLKYHCSCSNCKIENKWLRLKSNNTSYIVASVYRHPNGNSKHFTESLQKLLCQLDKKSTCIIAGDINIDLIKQENKNVNLYLETLLEYNFLPYISIPTRISDNSATLIDHINMRLPINQINKSFSWKLSPFSTVLNGQKPDMALFSYGSNLDNFFTETSLSVI